MCDKNTRLTRKQYYKDDFAFDVRIIFAHLRTHSLMFLIFIEVYYYVKVSCAHGSIICGIMTFNIRILYEY